jgi:hypothetical protein
MSNDRSSTALLDGSVRFLEAIGLMPGQRNCWALSGIGRDRSGQ